MEEALKNKPITNFSVPSDIQFLKIRLKSGKPANYGDPDSIFELFLQDFLPENEQPFTTNFQEEDY